MTATKRIAALTARHLKEIAREPVSLAFLYGMPVIMEVLFYFLFSQQTDQFRMEYLAPAMIGFANAFLSLFLGLLLALDRCSAFMSRLFTTEVRPAEFILSYGLSVLPLGVSQSVVIFLVAGIIDPSFWNVGLLYALLASLVSCLFFTAVGLFLGTACNEKAVGGVASIVITGQSILSAMWFPVEGMSQGFMTFLTILPFRNVALLVQNVFYPATFDSIGKPLLILFAYTIGFFMIAILIFKKKMRE